LSAAVLRSVSCRYEFAIVASALVCSGTRSPLTPVQSKSGANHATKNSVVLRVRTSFARSIAAITSVAAAAFRPAF
jgi:hypothetical protein